MKYFSTILTALVALVLLAAPVFGQETTDAAARIKDLEHKLSLLEKDKAVTTVTEASPAQNTADLEKRIKELEQKIEQLVKAQDTPALKTMSNEEQERALDPVALAGFYDNGYLVAQSKDGAFKYWLDGRVNLDYASYQGAENRLPSGVEVRRARIGIKATLFTNWLAEIDLDFADAAVGFKDLWMGYAFKNGVIRAGNHKAPFGLDTLTSSKNIMFIERAYIDALSPDRRIGVSYSGWGKHYQYSGGIFFQEAGLFDNKDTLTGGGAGTSQQLNLVGRVTAAPLTEKGKVLHFGMAAAYRKPDVSKIATSGADLPDRLNASRILKLDARAETHVSRAKFVSTGDMKFVDNFTQFNFEFAGVMGPVTFQSEYNTTKVNRIATTVGNYSGHSFGGYYGQIGWFITGERRLYSASEGEFLRVVPTRSAGAVEVGMKYSVIDLNDATAVDPILGGKAKNTTFGLTWFMNVNHKLLFNVVMVNNDALARPGKDWAPLPAGTSTAQNPIFGDDFTTFAVRYQIAF